VKTIIMECNNISRAFLSLHEADGFKTLPAASLLHSSAPMSFVMSAGLIQIENELPQIVAAIGNQFTFTQPCFRHFDVKQVGNDTMHLSLFQMSAAFYMGSTRRENVLPRLWHFLTQVLGLEQQRLWVTYLDDDVFGRDQQSYDCWRSIGVDKAHLIGLDHQHNFWRQRKSGQIARDGKKCGPHTEVFYERQEVVCRCNTADSNTTIKQKIQSCRCGRFVEVSNSLFIENYLNDKQQRIPADTVFSECVIGIERLAMILQNVPTVYHISRFSAWRNALQPLLPNAYNTQNTNVFDKSKATNTPLDKSLNIILDHLSAFVALINDGAPAPGRGGRARIMRNLARRAITHALLHDIDAMKLFQQLLAEAENEEQQANQQYCLDLLQQEYQRFAQTLERGKRKLIALKKANQLITQGLQDQFQYKWGIPPCLFTKFYTLLTTEGADHLSLRSGVLLADGNRCRNDRK
jgi:alanyl-tRNA synthetase